MTSPIANPGTALAEELWRHSEQDAAVTPMDAVADARTQAQALGRSVF